MAELRDRIHREQLRHGVASVVRDLILSRKVKPGDILRLGPIAEQLGVSITPVREALLLLAQDGWLAQEPNRGFLVLPTRRRDIEDIYLMWAAAEGAQASRAAQLATPADVEALRKVDAELHNRQDQTPPRALELNGELHDTIHRIADAPKLQWFTDAARRLVPYEFWFEFYSVPGWQELNSTDHTAIIDAIEAHNPEAAGEAMKQHYVETSKLLLKWLDSINFWDPEKTSAVSAS
jgi:DNA-binding GntR family transcriptional regulator